MKKMKIEGRFNYKDDKKKKKKKKNSKNLEKKFRKKEKKLKRKCECNHIAKNDGKRHFEEIKDENGNVIYNKCKICGDILIADKTLLTKSAVEDAAIVMTTVFGLSRNHMVINPTLNNDITKCLYFVKKAPEIIEELGNATKKKKKNKKDKMRKKNKKKYNRREIY